MAGTGPLRRNIIAMTVALIPAFVSSPSGAASEKVGVNSAVNPQAEGTPPAAPTRRLELGQEVVHNERIVTAPEGQTQILFLDASAMTVGPSSDLTIDDFVYNPSADTGQLAMSMTKGVARFVGGKISKLDNAVTMRTPSASIGIRGGVFLLSVSQGGQIEVVFLYGKGLIVNANGQTQLVTRPGWAVTVSGPGAPPSKAAPASEVEIANLLNQLTGRPGATGGAPNHPTEPLLAGSGVPAVISGNPAASTQQATRNSPPKSQPPVVDVGGLVTQFQINDVAVQPIVAAMPVNNSSSGTTFPTNPITPPTVAFPTTGVGSFSGTASGTVVNNGTTYQATGGFSQVYNFGSQSGVVGISNFDGANYGYSVAGSGSNFSGPLTSGPANRTGALSGAFSGPGATQTGGNFGVQSTAGPGYTISGTFSGR